MSRMDNTNTKELPTKPVDETVFTTGHPIIISPTLLPVTFTIGLDSFAITNTRSLHEDTDFVTVSLAIANHPPVSQTRALGKRNNGNFPLNMDFSKVSIAHGETAVLTYNMVNSGHQDPNKVETELKTLTETLAQKGAQIASTAVGTAIGSALGAAIGTAVVPIIGTALGSLAGYLVGGAFGLIFADCDGPVASAVHVLTYDQIKAVVASGKAQTHTDNHPGIDSADGCGSNSHYTVTWSVK